MSMSAQNTVKRENTTLVPQAPSMPAHGTYQKGSSKQLGLIQALKIAAAFVLFFGLAIVMLSSKPSAHPHVASTKGLASTVSSESQKAREASYKQSKPLGSIFTNPMGDVIASPN